MTDVRLYVWNSKVVLRFKNQTSSFLKDYSTNTFDRPYNAFVDIRGRIVATFHACALSDDEVLILTEGRFKQRLFGHLEKYLAFTETRIEEDPKWNVYLNLEGGYRAGGGEFVIPLRVGARLVVTAKKLEADVSEEEWTRFRVERDIPVQGIDYDEEMLLDLNDEDYVSYTKGCYLGQEILARVHYRGRPPRKLVVRSEGECTPEELGRMTSKITDPLTGKIRGFVFISNPG